MVQSAAVRVRWPLARRQAAHREIERADAADAQLLGQLSRLLAASRRGRGRRHDPQLLGGDDLGVEREVRVPHLRPQVTTPVDRHPRAQRATLGVEQDERRRQLGVGGAPSVPCRQLGAQAEETRGRPRPRPFSAAEVTTPVTPSPGKGSAFEHVRGDSPGRETVRRYCRRVPLALITGAARANSIAAGVAPRLAADGWQVVTSDLKGVDYECDLADAAGPARLIEQVRCERGPITALVLSHAHDVVSGVLDTTAESFDLHVAVNARASLLLIAAFARQVPEGGGVVVALTSDATTGNLPYGASKGALDRVVISAARELGPLGISANVVNPGPIDTGWMNDELRGGLASGHPLGRLGTPSDIAGVVSFLVSAEGRWVTGQLLHTDGGFSARF